MVIVVKKPVIHYSPEEIRQQLQQAPEVHLRNRFWEPWEDEIVKLFFGKRDTQLIAEKLNRTIASIQSRAAGLGLTRKGREK